MNKEEIALQLTLTALECGAIGIGKHSAPYYPKENDPINEANMKSICTAYKTALAELKSEQ